MADDLRLLDVEVHRKVFGRECDYWHAVDGGTPPTDWYDRRNHHEPVPYYTTDYKAMGLLIEKLTEQQYVKVRVESTYWHGAFCTITAPDPTQIDDSDLIRKDSPPMWGLSMPEAVVQATLMALEGKS